MYATDFHVYLRKLLCWRESRKLEDFLLEDSEPCEAVGKKYWGLRNPERPDSSNLPHHHVCSSPRLPTQDMLYDTPRRLGMLAHAGCTNANAGNFGVTCLKHLTRAG